MRGLTLCVFLFSVSLISCTRCVDIRIFNHTGARIVIVGFDPSGEQHTWTLAEGESAVGWYLHRWEIRASGPVAAIWFYDPAAINYLSGKYLTENWLGSQHSAMQIEPDGNIWAVPPDTRAIVVQLPPQPVGYPAKPSKIGRP
jgi:hypothetical protein